MIGSFSPRVLHLGSTIDLFSLAYQSTLYVLLFLWVFEMKSVSLIQVNVGPLHLHPELLFRDYASFGLHAHTLLLNITADGQKAK